MGSATTQAQSATEAALRAAASIDLGVSRELFAAARALGESSQLSGALADAAAPLPARNAVVATVFGSFQPATIALLNTAVKQRWSSASDLVTGIEELAVRAAAIAAPTADIESELFAFTRTVADNPELELAVNGRFGNTSAKGELVSTLLAGRASEATVLVATALVQQTRDRRVRQILNRAMAVVADQRSRTVASVVSAVPLSAAQLDRLGAVLATRYGTQVALNTIIDPDVVGGLRVQIGDDVIDASISTRLHDLRQRLAG